jgi:hypothetical protein
VSTNGGEWVEKTVGLKGSTTVYHWYWAKGENTVVQDSTETKLAAAGEGTVADRIKIVYTGLYQIVVVSSNYAEMLARKATEGIESTGIVESVKADSLLTDKDAALDEANSLLAVNAKEGKKIEYTTTSASITAGTLQYIKLTKHDVDDEFLISNVEYKTKIIDGADYCDVTGFSGPVETTWADVFVKMNEAQKKALNPSEIGSADVLLVLITFTKTWTDVETPNIWQTVLADAHAYSTTAFLPCFEAGDRIKYLSLRKSGLEVYRMYRTDQTSTASSIITTFIVGSANANGDIDQAVLIGGDSATMVEGTGVEVETHSFVYTKNSLESLQLQFTSSRWV